MNKLILYFCSAAKALAFVFFTIPTFSQNLDAIEKDLVEAYAPFLLFFG